MPRGEAEMAGLGTLNQRDRQDFEKRLARYSLQAEAAHETVSVPAKTRLAMKSAPRITPHAVAASSMAALQQVLGVPLSAKDHVVREKLALVKRWQPQTLEIQEATLQNGKPPTAAMLQHLPARALHPSDVAAIRAAADLVRFGHADAVAHLSGLIDHYLGAINLSVAVWPVLEVTVGAGAVLEFDANVNLLCAYKVVIEAGGSIQSAGKLSLDCTILQNN
jgi:hypothetical protein